MTKVIKNYGAKFLGFGRGLPERIVDNFELEKIFDTSDEWISQRTGIKERRIVDPDKGESATSLGLKAAKSALADHIKAEEIDLIICATATGDNLFPSTACMIQNELGAVNAAAFDISAACTGYIYALNTAYNFIQSGQSKNILIVAVDLMSKFVDWEDRRAAIIFGDGAGATLLQACPAEEDEIQSFFIKSSGDAKCSLTLKNASTKYPIPLSQNTEKPATVHMDGQAVYQFAVKALPESIEQACQRAGISPEELDLVVPHQANMRIIESASKRLKVPLDKFICNIDRYGNTSAASVPIAIDEAIEQGKLPKPGTSKEKLKIALCGFGAGLTWGAAVINY